MAKTMTNTALVEGTGLTDSLTTLYTVPPTNLASIISSIRICNYSTEGANFDIHIVPSGKSASNDTLIARYLDLPGASIWTDMSAITMPPGSTLQAKAGKANALTIYVSGIEVTNS